MLAIEHLNLANLVYWYWHGERVTESLRREREAATTLPPPPRGTTPQAVDSGYPQGRGRGIQSTMNQD